MKFWTKVDNCLIVGKYFEVFEQVQPPGLEGKDDSERLSFCDGIILFSSCQLSASICYRMANRESSWSPGPERRQEDSGTSKDVSRPRIELGSQELASCAITAGPPQHDTTVPRHRAFDVFQGSCYTILLPSARHPARASKPFSATSCNRRETWVEEYCSLWGMYWKTGYILKRGQKRCNSWHGNVTENRASLVRSGEYIPEGQREQVKVTGRYNRCS